MCIRDRDSYVAMTLSDVRAETVGDSVFNAYLGFGQERYADTVQGSTSNSHRCTHGVYPQLI